MRSTPGALLGPKRVHALAQKVRAALDARPEATVAELMKATGASINFVTRVRQRWVMQRPVTPAP